MLTLCCCKVLSLLSLSSLKFHGADNPADCPHHDCFTGVCLSASPLTLGVPPLTSQPRYSPGRDRSPTVPLAGVRLWFLWELARGLRTAYANTTCRKSSRTPRFAKGLLISWGAAEDGTLLCPGPHFLFPRALILSLVLTSWFASWRGCLTPYLGAPISSLCSSELDERRLFSVDRPAPALAAAASLRSLEN